MEESYVHSSSDAQSMELRLNRSVEVISSPTKLPTRSVIKWLRMCTMNSELVEKFFWHIKQ